MSPLHAYCIRRASDPPPPSGFTGLGGAAVEVVEAGPLAVWLSRGSDHPGAAELRAHNAVVREGMKSRTLLPLRFGTSFRDVDAARQAVREREEEFSGTLDWLGERVEMGLRVSRLPGGDSVREATIKTPAEPTRGVISQESPPPQGEARGRGRAFLEERRRALREQESALAESRAILDALASELADLDAPIVQTILPDKDLVGMLAHLVHRGAITLYRSRAVELQLGHPGLRIVATGPWAPYSFVAPRVEQGEGAG